MIEIRGARPRWRSAVAVAANGYRLVVVGGLRSWRRDLAAAAPAMGSIVLLLVLAGVLGLLGVAVRNVAVQQAASASVLEVYISSNASAGDVAALQARLAADPRVASVQDITPEAALARARSRPGLGDLADLTSTNPFSEALEVKVRQLPQIAAVAASVHDDPAVDPAGATSYDPQAYDGLRNLALGVGGAGAGLVALLAFVSYAVSANAIRSIALSRRDEIATIRLLAARRWMVRGPFVVEGLTTGAFAGAVAAALVAVAWRLANQAGAGVYEAILPGVGLRALELDAAALMTAGMALGAVAAAFGVRRLTA